MKLKCTPILVLMFLLALCDCSSHRHRPHGGKLSEAMEKSSDTYEGDRRIDTSHGSSHANHHPVGHHEETPSPRPQSTSQTPQPGPQTETEETWLNVTLAGGVGLFKSDDFHPVTHFDLSIGAYGSEKHRFELYAGLGWAQVDQSDTLDSALNDGITMFSLGLRYKYFTTPRYTFLGHYLTAGGGFTEMFWRYRNDIIVDGQTIGSDSIDGFEIFAGMGFHLAQTRHFQFGLEVLPSAIFWSAYTREGFDNDVFGNPLMLKLRVTATYLP